MHITLKKLLFLSFLSLAMSCGTMNYSTILNQSGKPVLVELYLDNFNKKRIEIATDSICINDSVMVIYQRFFANGINGYLANSVIAEPINYYTPCRHKRSYLNLEEYAGHPITIKRMDVKHKKMVLQISLDTAQAISVGYKYTRNSGEVVFDWDKVVVLQDSLLLEVNSLAELKAEIDSTMMMPSCGDCVMQRVDMAIIE